MNARHITEVSMAKTAGRRRGNEVEGGSLALVELYPNRSAPVDLARAYAFPDAHAPWVRANFVSSLDGAATLGGRSGGLGNATDREIFALLRALADVVLVGAGTARAEGYGPAEVAPEWRALRAGRARTPAIAVVSHRLDFDPTAPLFTTAPSHARTIVLTDASSSRERRRALAGTAEVIVAGDRRVEPAAAVHALVQRGYRRISCEGGPSLLADLVAAGVLDELCLTQSPVLVVGDATRITKGTTPVAPLGMRLAHLLAEGSYLFSRYTRTAVTAEAYKAPGVPPGTDG